MTDLIAPVVFSIFGALMLVVVLGFYLLTRRSRRPAFEAEDYFKYDKRREPRATPYVARSEYFNPRRSANNEISEPWGIRTKIVVALVIITLLTASIAATYGYFEGLILFLALPVIVRFIRSRKDARRQAATDGN